MRFVTFAVDGKSRPGVLSGQTISDLSTAGFSSLLDFIESGPQGRTAAEKLAAAGGGYPLDKIKLLAPIPRPRKLICVGLNYRDHAAETNSEIPSVPTIFNKFATAVIAPGDNIVLPKVSTSPDYEAEFAFVIGRGGRNIARRRLAKTRLWLHHRERCERARLSTGDHAMAHGQNVRYLRSYGPLDRQR